MNPETGNDLDPALLQKISGVLDGKYTPSDSYEEAQLRELAFWRWVAYEGYAGKKPLEFFDHQKAIMTACYAKTGWSIDRFSNQRIFELGCGPVGMIEFIPGQARYAFDPLNEHYSALFQKLRRSGVQYFSKREEVDALSPVEFGICFNVLDHTNDSSEWFDLFFRTIVPGGQFLLQVNTVKDGYERTAEHNKMHPSPLNHEQISGMLSIVSADFQCTLDSEPSADNEFFFMAWGSKNL